ncbi:zinc-finger domain-containing protein, partial [Bacillus cereus]
CTVGETLKNYGEQFS